MPGAHLESSRRVVVAEWAGGGQAVSAALLSSQNLGREGDPVHALLEEATFFLLTHLRTPLSNWKLLCLK